MPDARLREVLAQNAAHLCVDMQNMFAKKTEWHTPWMARVVPQVARIVETRPERTIFTRFVPPRSAEDREGTWRTYYERWASMTLDRMPAEMVELVPELARFVPPAMVIDKPVYSPWNEPRLQESLRAQGIRSIVVTGGETDVCVLGAVLGAVDRGFRIIVVKDALCSSSDRTHDAMLTLYHERYGQQVDVATTDEVVEAWRELV